MFCLCGFLPYLSLKTDENQKKKQIKMHCCTWALCAIVHRRKFRSCTWSLHTFTSKRLHLNHPTFWPLGVVTSWSGTGNENFWKWDGSIRLDWTDRSKRTTVTWKVPPGPNLSIYVWTEISPKFWHNGKQPKSPCFDHFVLRLIKLITDPSPNHFSGSYVALTDWFAKGSMHFDYWYLPRVFWNL